MSLESAVPRKVVGEHEAFVPISRSFLRCFIRAQDVFGRCKEPAWFREQFGRGEAIEEQFGLSPKIPLIYALALHLWFTDAPSANRLKGFRRKLLGDERSSHASVRKDLRKIRSELLKLRQSAFVWPLGPEVVDSWEEHDGSLGFELGPDPVDELALAIDRFMERLSTIQFERHKAPVGDVVCLLERFIERNNPSLSSKQREELGQTLIGPVLLHHRRLGRSADRDPDDPDDAPRLRDYLARRPVAPPKGKSVQKLG